MKLQELLQNPEYKQKFVLEKFIQLVLGYDREAMRLHLEQELSPTEREKIITYYNQYAIDKKPMEYILGHVDFFWVSFFVDENTLIPRPETEYMITAVSEHITTPLWRGEDPQSGSGGSSADENSSSNNNILMDIWTGCGVLGISVLLQNPNFFKYVFFSDISTEALQVAIKNYNTHIQSENHDAKFIQSDLIAFIESYPDIVNQANITLVANLPYIPEETFDTNSPDNVQKREPKMAFVGGNDGLIYYRQMFEQLQNLLKSKIIIWNQLTMFLEMMTRQVEILKAEFGQRIAFEEVKTFHFNIRIVKAWIK